MSGESSNGLERESRPWKIMEKPVDLLSFDALPEVSGGVHTTEPALPEFRFVLWWLSTSAGGTSQGWKGRNAAVWMVIQYYNILYNAVKQEFRMIRIFPRNRWFTRTEEVRARACI